MDDDSTKVVLDDSVEPIAKLALEISTKKRRGKPPKVPMEERDKKLGEKLNEIYVDGQMVSSTSRVYYDIAEELGVTKQAIYLAAKRYLADIFSPEPYVDYIEQENKSMDDDEEYTPDEYFGEGFTIFPTDTCLDINIKDFDLFYKSTAELQLNCEWSDTVSEIIWKFCRLPCAWTFERMRNVCNEIVIVGRCLSLDCSKIFGFTQNNQSTLKIVIKSFNETTPHLKKRSMKYSRKDKIDKLLASNSACVVHAKLANSLMTDGDEFQPADLPNTGTLRVQKHRSNKTSYLHEIVILAIRMMKEISTYFQTIGDVGLDPFYLLYATPLQAELLRSKTRYRRCVISLDATGLPILSMKFSSVSDEDHLIFKDCFLYVISCQSPDRNFPAFQFISQRQSSDFIQYALACWRYKHFSKKNPDEVIMDDSKALLLGTVQCFTSCKTMHQYLDDCYDALFNNGKAPRCYVRLDRAHIVKAIKRMECLQREDKRRKIFYQRLFGFLITADNVNDVEQILIKTFILLLNKYEFDEYVMNSKKYLKRICDNHLIEKDDEIEASPISNDSSVIFSSQSKFRQWIVNIIENVKQQHVNEFLNNSVDSNADENLIDNVLYAPHLEKPFIDFLVKLPLFSNIMNKAFHSNNLVASSPATEVGFNVIKHCVLSGSSRIRLDTFLEKHIEFLNGDFKGKVQNNKENSDLEDNYDESEHPAETCEVYNENWRNKNIDAKKPTSIIRTKRCKTSILNPSKPLNRYIPILKNGHRTIGTKAKQGILSTQSCPFDSIFQIYAACYADLPCFADKVNLDNSAFSELIKNLFSKKDVYELRNEMLLTLLPEQVIDYGPKIKAIDAETSVHTMFMRLSANYPIIHSYEEYKSCVSCNFSSAKVGKSFMPTNLKLLELSQLKNCICFNSKLSECPNCSAVTAIGRDFNKIIAFDVEPTAHKENLVNLSDISQLIGVGDHQFVLKGVVEFTFRHFISHIRRNDGEWETYDDMNFGKTRKTPKAVYPVQLFYTLANDDASDDAYAVKDIVQDDNCLLNDAANADALGDIVQDNNALANKRSRRLPNYLDSYYVPRKIKRM